MTRQFRQSQRIRFPPYGNFSTVNSTQDFQNIYTYIWEEFPEFQQDSCSTHRIMVLRFLASSRITVLLRHFGEIFFTLRDTKSYTVYQRRTIHYNTSTFHAATNNSPSMMLVHRALQNNNKILWHYQTIRCHIRGNGRFNLRPSPHFKQQI
jgi:hypothetical protein